MKPKDRESLIQVLKDFFRRESDQCGIEMAFLYGSWARGYPMKGSDVDLAVCFQQPEDLAKLAIQRNRLAHRYLNFRWQAISMYKAQRFVIQKLLALMLEREEKGENEK